MRALLAVAALACCGVDAAAPDVHLVHPIEVFVDANEVYARAWCGWEERCEPEAFALYYGDSEFCGEYNADGLCVQEGVEVCRGPFPPEQRQYLAPCAEHAAADPCSFGWPVACVLLLVGKFWE